MSLDIVQGKRLCNGLLLKVWV